MSSIHLVAVNPPALLVATVFPFLGLALSVVLLTLFVSFYLIKRYKRCPSNKVLVVFGRVAGDTASRCFHGGGTLVIPLVQDHAYLPLEPITVEFQNESAASKENALVTISAKYTVAISTEADLMHKAAERLLDLDVFRIEAVTRDIILGQIRQTLAGIPIDEMNQDRARLVERMNESVGQDLQKLGLEIFNMNLDHLSLGTVEPDRMSVAKAQA